MLQLLLPRGRVWLREVVTTQTAVLRGLTLTCATLDACAAFLPTDAFPASTFELLPEREATLGPSRSLRRFRAHRSLRCRRGRRTAHCDGRPVRCLYAAVAAATGYAITTRQFAPSQFGAAFCSLFADDD
ncbi:DUF2313 domain-containing protein [Paraburkholderia sp. UCT31]|nr:DUF2313 domain-containing protein [Paraburkholderia sp. UCT31]